LLPRLLALILLFAAAVSANAETRSGSTLLLQTLLTSDNQHFVLMGAKAVQRDPSANQFTLDLVAELLSERIDAHAATGLDLDTTAWFMKALGTSKSERYRDVIERTIAAYANDKITTFGNLSLAELTKPSASSFAKGTISLEGLRKELLEERAARSSRPDLALNIKDSDSLDSVIVTMGFPDALIETVDAKGFGRIKIRVRSLQLQYYGRGLVDIDNHFNAGSGWTVSQIWLDVPNKAAPYSGTDAADAAMIMTSEPMALRKLSRQLASRHVTEGELLDRMAERIQISMDSQDDFEIIALRYFCRILGESGNKKYLDALSVVAAKSGNYGLQQYAKAGREKLEAL
jgi:hypothetical protein